MPHVSEIERRNRALIAFTNFNGRARCENGSCAHIVIAYNSRRNWHCPRARRRASCLPSMRPIPHFHAVFTLSAAIAEIAYQIKAAIYGILFKASVEATLTIALADASC